MSTKEQKKRLELLQGKRDLLILRTLSPGPAHARAIAKAIEFNSDALLRWNSRRQPVVEAGKWGKPAGAITGILRPAERGARQGRKP